MIDSFIRLLGRYIDKLLCQIYLIYYIIISSCFREVRFIRSTLPLFFKRKESAYANYSTAP